MASTNPRTGSAEGAAPVVPPVPAPAEDVERYAGTNFAEAFDRAGVGMALIALDGRFLRVNDAMTRIMRRSSKEMLATSWPAVTHPESRGVVEWLIREALTGATKSHDGEIVFVRGDGEAGCGLVSASVITDERDRGLFFFVQMFDLTARKEIEEQLEEKTSWVRLLQGVAVAANAATTFEEAVRAAVDQVCHHTGWPLGHVYRVDESGTLVSTDIWQMADPAAYTDFRRASEAERMNAGEGLPGRVLETGRRTWMNDVSNDTRFIRHYAARAAGLHAALAFPVNVEDHVVAVMEFFSTQRETPDAAFLEVMEHIGTLLGQAGEHRLIEEALVDNEERTRQIIETAGDAFIEMDSSGLITDWNAKAAESFGWMRDEVIGRSLCTTIIPEQYRDAHNKGLAKYLETGKGPLLGQRIEVSALRRDGSEMPVELTLWETTIAGVTRFNAFIHDITERKQAQEALEEANRKLQVWVEELERRNREINELIETREDLRVQSLRDPLTDLFNRRYMEESLEREIQRAIRSGEPLGVIMIDIDHFKTINDTHGHEVGDVVLQKLAAFLQENVRGSDIACRYGGEEFLLIFPDAPLKATRRRAETLRKGARDVDISIEGRPIEPPTLSLGVAVFPKDGETGQALLRAADAALYRAKNSGRDRVVSAGELL